MPSTMKREFSDVITGTIWKTKMRNIKTTWKCLKLRYKRRKLAAVHLTLEACVGDTRTIHILILAYLIANKVSTNFIHHILGAGYLYQ
jgi:hypothetical protein